MQSAAPEKITGNITSKEDRLSTQKTLYEASYSEIFWKNFLAGFGRSAGGLVIYAFFLSVLGGVLVKFVMPIITPMFNQLQSISNSLNRVPRF